MYVFFRHFLKKYLHSLWSRDYDYKQIQDVKLKTRKNGKFPDQVIFLWTMLYRKTFQLVYFRLNSFFNIPMFKSSCPEVFYTKLLRKIW